MDKKELQAETAYLIRKAYFYSGKIEWIKILQSSQTSYKIQYEGGGCNWVTKEHFHSNYIIVEELNKINITIKKIEELIEMQSKDKNSVPFPLSIIPNYMGINLNSVNNMRWEALNDGQLVSLTINFTPAINKPII